MERQIKKEKNIQSLQAIRAIAALSVVATHMFSDPYPFLSFAGIVGVDIFFALSGFLMTITYNESKSGIDFLFGRIKRIYPCYLIISAPLIIWSTIKYHPTVFNVFQNITLLPSLNENYNDFERASGVSWTLTYEMYFYIIMALCMYLAKGIKSVTLMTMAVIASVFIFIGGFSDGSAGWSGKTINDLASNYIILDFLLGSACGLLYHNNIFKINLSDLSKVIIVSFIYITSVTLITIINPIGTNDNYQMLVFIFSGIPSAFIVFLCSQIQISGNVFYKGMVYLGGCSYSIYLSHYYFKIVSDAIPLNQSIIKPVFFIMSVIVGCLIYEIIEKRLNFILKKKQVVKV